MPMLQLVEEKGLLMEFSQYLAPIANSENKFITNLNHIIAFNNCVCVVSRIPHKDHECGFTIYDTLSSIHVLYVCVTHCVYL